MCILLFDHIFVGSRVLQLSYGSRPNSYDNQGHLDENRNSSKDQQCISAAVPENDTKRKWFASSIRRSFSFDSDSLLTSVWKEISIASAALTLLNPRLW